MNFCEDCGQKYLEQERFCSECGKERVSAPVLNTVTSCKECKTKFTSPTERFCAECGTPRTVENSDMPIKSIAKKSVSFAQEDLFGPPPVRMQVTPVVEKAAKSDKVQDHLDSSSASMEKIHSTLKTESNEDLARFTESALKIGASNGQRASVTKTENHGNGSDVVIENVYIVNGKKSSLDIRKAMGKSVHAYDDTNGYVKSKVQDHVTSFVAEKHQLNDLLYEKRVVKSEEEFYQMFSKLQRENAQFTDEQFPPSDTSIFTNTNDKSNSPLYNVATKWRRISDFFTQSAYIQVTMYADSSKLISGISMKKEDVYKSASTSNTIDPKYYDNAKQAVLTAMRGDKRDHCLLLTKTLIEYMTEYVDNAKQRFESFWHDHLVKEYAPLTFSNTGDMKAWNIAATDGKPAKIAVIVPLLFKGTQVHLYKRQTTSNVSRIGNIRQGRISNGYFTNVLSALTVCDEKVAELFPEIPAHLKSPDAGNYEQQYNKEGIYAIRFWRHGKLRVVVVDDYIPCNNAGRPCFAGFTSHGFEIWSMIVEKAFAKLNGSYESIVGGQENTAFSDCCGGVTQSFSIGRESKDTLYTGMAGKEKLWKRMANELNCGTIYTCKIDSESLDSNLEASQHRKALLRSQSSNSILCIEPLVIRSAHAYSIMQLVELSVKGKKHRLVQLRSSWDDLTYQGEWSRLLDKRWALFSAEQKRRLKVTLANEDDDGSIWVDYTSLDVHFTTMLETRDLLVRSDTTCISVLGEWYGSTAAGRKALHLNPQYHLVLPKGNNCRVLVELEQCSRRPRNLVSYDAFIAPIVGQNATLGERKIDLTHDVLQTGTFISSRFSNIEIELDTSSGTLFIIIPSTYEAGRNLSFHLMIYVDGGAALYPVSDSGLPLCTMCQNPIDGAYRTFRAANDVGEERICSQCVDDYRQQNLKRCIHCSECIEASSKYTGRYFTLPDQSHCHQECMESFNLARADRCIQCHDPILKIPGKFDGRYFELPNGSKYHTECQEAYQSASAERCAHCHEGIRVIAGKYNGQFYKTDANEKVHFECWMAYNIKHAEKCVHCTQPIMKLDGKFDGRFYDLLSRTGKVHFECWDSYCIQKKH